MKNENTIPGFVEQLREHFHTPTMDMPTHITDVPNAPPRPNRLSQKGKRRRARQIESNKNLRMRR